MSEPHIAYFHMGQWPVYVGFTTSPKAFKREIKRMGTKEKVSFFARERATATTHIFTAPEGCLCFIITMPKPTKAVSHSQYAALVAHEALHIIQEMQRELNRGASFGDEADAYLIQMIVQDCLHIAFDEGLEKRTIPQVA